MQSLTRTALGLAPLARVTPTRASAANRLQGRRRQFHLSAVGDAVIWTADGISSIHAAGVPWYLSIPLVAVGVNVSFRLPVQHYTRRLVGRRNELNPLVAAWGSRHAATVPRGRDEAAERVWRLRVAGLTETSRRRIYKAWGVQRWKTLAPFLSMLPFVVVSEALRRLCGAPMGWIGHRLGLANAERISSALADSSGLVDQSLAQGGCLWFADLTAMDPYYVLPLLCSALLARTSWGRLSKDQLRALLTIDASKTPKTPMSRVQTAIGRTLLLVPLLPLVFADLPSAIFLYWATAFGLNDVNESILERLVPKRTPKLKAVQKAPAALPYLRGTDPGVPTK
ncbi:Mitochondrial inner membrane protein COX18 [Tolypocladium paradoxum]|uniref:Mitochondrial inner membrane protein COX18 n=1 Tax=Tolypocladium paradoxum TaxID=94208 RepID=A0A2S4L6D4_9HYPO|nr:Mitochondrial inner membrane protein COX18 [Tolypocladium paradoxum]